MTPTLRYDTRETDPMSLEYLLIFGLGLAVATVLATMGGDIVDFVLETIRELIE